jgi:hypothetical protein
MNQGLKRSIIILGLCSAWFLIFRPYPWRIDHVWPWTHLAFPFLGVFIVPRLILLVGRIDPSLHNRLVVFLFTSLNTLLLTQSKLFPLGATVLNQVESINPDANSHYLWLAWLIMVLTFSVISTGTNLVLCWVEDWHWRPFRNQKNKR